MKNCAQIFAKLPWKGEKGREASSGYPNCENLSVLLPGSDINRLPSELYIFLFREFPFVGNGVMGMRAKTICRKCKLNLNV